MVNLQDLSNLHSTTQAAPPSAIEVGDFVQLLKPIESSGVFDALMGIRDTIAVNAIGTVKEIDEIGDPDGHSIGVEFSQEGVIWWIEPKNLKVLQKADDPHLPYRPVAVRVTQPPTASAPAATANPAAASEASGEGDDFDTPKKIELPTEMTLKQLIMLPNRGNIVAEYHGKEILMIHDGYEDMTWPVYYTDGSSESLTYNTIVSLRETGYHNLTIMPAAAYRVKSRIAALRAKDAELQLELARLRSERDALLTALKPLIGILNDDALDEARNEWGNTNVAVAKHHRDIAIALVTKGGAK